MRHAPMGTFAIQVTKLEIELFRELSEEGRLRLEVPESTKEVVLAEVRDTRESEADADVRIADENEQTVAEVRMKLKFKHTPAIA
ncbi:hypothetical protein D3C72_2327720 [compost metagenome]